MPYPSKQGEIVERMELNQLFGTILLAALMFLPVSCAGTVQSVKGWVGHKRDLNIHIVCKPSGAPKGAQYE